MKKSPSSLFFLPVFHLVYACSYYYPDYPSYVIPHFYPPPITDIRTPTPYTFVNTISFIDCPANPTTVSIWYTAYVDGNAYPAPTQVSVYTGASVVYNSYVFSGLTVNTLVPGEIITLSWTEYFPQFSKLGSSDILVTVAPTALVQTTPTSTPTGPTPTTLPPSRHRPPIGLIVGAGLGALFAIVVLMILLVVWWSRIRIRRAVLSARTDNPSMPIVQPIELAEFPSEQVTQSNLGIRRRTPVRDISPGIWESEPGIPRWPGSRYPEASQSEY